MYAVVMKKVVLRLLLQSLISSCSWTIFSYKIHNAEQLQTFFLIVSIDIGIIVLDFASRSTVRGFIMQPILTYQFITVPAIIQLLNACVTYAIFIFHICTDISLINLLEICSWNMTLLKCYIYEHIYQKEQFKYFII